MLICVYINEDRVMRQAMLALGREFTMHGHQVFYSNVAMFNGSQLERADGVFVPGAPGKDAVRLANLVVSAYDDKAHVFSLQHEDQFFFVADSPKVTLREMRQIVEFLTDDNP